MINNVLDLDTTTTSSATTTTTTTNNGCEMEPPPQQMHLLQQQPNPLHAADISMISHHAQCDPSPTPFVSRTLPRNPQQHHFQHFNGAFYTSTLPKPPLKGILKNSNNYNGGSMTTILPIEVDVIPFDTVPPCDDCMEKARVEGSYSGHCDRQECAMGSLKRKPKNECAELQRQHRRNSTRSLRSLHTPDLATTAFRDGSQESVYNCDETAPEVIENVESSV